MNTQILYTVLFVTDYRYFKYIYIMLIKLISWKRFTNCFDLDIWYFFKQLWFQKTHTHTCICFSHSGTNCHPYSMCIYMNYHGSIMRVSSRSWCHNKLILSLATVYDNQNPVTLATSWYDSIWNLFYIKDVGSHSFLQLCDFHEKFTPVRITRNIHVYQNQSKEPVKSNEIFSVKNDHVWHRLRFYGAHAKMKHAVIFLHFFKKYCVNL